MGKKTTKFALERIKKLDNLGEDFDPRIKNFLTKIMNDLYKKDKKVNNDLDKASQQVVYGIGICIWEILCWIIPEMHLLRIGVELRIVDMPIGILYRFLSTDLCYI